MTRRVLVSFVVVLLVAVVPPANAAPQNPADPWAESMALEASGDLRRARAVMVQAFSELPDSYDACIRIAGLSLRLKEAAHAAALYRRARQLPGAGEGAAEGLVAALTTVGYGALDRGDLGAARRSWQEAIAIDAAAVDASRGLDLVGPSRGGSAEGWVGHLASYSSSANVFYLHVPVRVSDSVSVRGAFRQIGSARTDTGVTPVFGSQQELYGGVSVEGGIAATEMMAFGLRNTLEHVPGLAATTRIGGRYGVTVTASGMRQTTGWNTQALPQAFVWPRPWLAVAAGVRVTHDPLVSATSAVFGGTLRLHRTTLDGQAHLGTERWAFAMAGPTVMSFAASTTHGATLTGSVPVKPVTLYVQFQFERLGAQESATGNRRYLGLACGFRWDPARARNDTRGRKRLRLSRDSKEESNR